MGVEGVWQSGDAEEREAESGLNLIRHGRMAGERTKQRGGGVELMIADEEQGEAEAGELEGFGAAFEAEVDAALQVDASVLVVVLGKFGEPENGPCGSVRGVLLN